MNYPLPTDEADRLRAVESYGIYGTDPEPAFNDLSELAAQIAEAPFCMVNIISETSSWLKARHGLPPDMAEVPRGAVCCAHTICQSDLLVIPDLLEDPRSKNLPFVATEPFVRFYAGVPLINPEGYALGTLCLFDMKPRKLTFEVAEALRRLARQVVAQLELRRRLAEIEDARARLVEEKSRAEELILNILPADIASELASEGRVEPRHHDSTTILFSDFVGFTRFAERLAPRMLVDELHECFSGFDEIVARTGMEKLKTIGDAYMAVSGVPAAKQGHAADACLTALQFQQLISRLNVRREKLNMEPWRLRIGIHTGSVMAGVVGKDKFTYDIWGDAVNVAARIEAASKPGQISVSESTYHRVKDLFELADTGVVDAKNKGELRTYRLDRLKSHYSADQSGCIPNEAFREKQAGGGASWVLPGD